MAVDQGNITTPNAADLNAAARRYCAAQGWAMPDGSYPIRPANNHGADDASKAVRAVGRGNANANTIRKFIISRMKDIGLGDQIPDTWGADGSLMAGRAAVAPVEEFFRTFTFDMEIKERAKGGDGRTLYGYAVPFGQVQEIDRDLTEAFDSTAFDHQMRAMNRVGYWHYHSRDPRTAHVGHLTMARAESKGLYQEASIANTVRGNDLLELVKNDSITEQSVGFRCGRAGTQMRDGVAWRTKADLTELAAVPNGAYGEGAPIMGVRSAVTMDACPHCGHVEMRTGFDGDMSLRGIELTIADLEPDSTEARATGTPALDKLKADLTMMLIGDVL